MKKLDDLRNRISVVGPAPFYCRITDWGTRDMFCDFLTESAGIEYFTRLEANEETTYICRVYLKDEIGTPDIQALLENYGKYEQSEIGHDSV